MIYRAKVISPHQFLLNLDLKIFLWLEIVHFGPQPVHVINFFLIFLHLQFVLLMYNRAQNRIGITIVSHVYNWFSIDTVSYWLGRWLLVRTLNVHIWMPKLMFMILIPENIQRWNNLLLIMFRHIKNALSFVEFSGAWNHLVIRVEAFLDNCVGVVLLVILNLLNSFRLVDDFLIFSSLNYRFSLYSFRYFSRWLRVIAVKLVLFHRAVVAQFSGRNSLVDLFGWHEFCSLWIRPG